MKKTLKGNKPLWASSNTTVNQLNLRYTSDRDVAVRPMADEVLTPYDILGTKAHVTQLKRIGALTTFEASKIIKSLNNAQKLYEKGLFKLNPEFEDVHMNLEAFVSSAKECGPIIGGKMHTARSRNDQAATAMRLYMRDQCLQIQKDIFVLIKTLLAKGQEYAMVLMAGITHHQNAVSSTLGHLYYSYAEALIRDAERLEHAFSVINVSPLGAVAGYGTTWPLNRPFSAKLLNFDEVLSNTIDCVTNRWEPEAELASALSFLMNHLSTISQDIIFLSTSSNPALKLPLEFTTGSSVMPQKRNPDFAEATKARTALLHGYLSALFSIGKGNVSGYNKDTQWTKYLIMDTIFTCQDAPLLFSHVIKGIEPNKLRLFKQTEEGFLCATDLADMLVREGNLPFRRAYLIVKEATAMGLEKIDYPWFTAILNKHEPKINISEELFDSTTNPLLSIKLKNHDGGPAPVALKKLKSKLNNKLKLLKFNYAQNRKKIDNAM